MRIRTALLATGAAAVAGAAAYSFAIRPWWQTWGVDPELASAALPGDDLVADPMVVDTRAIEIDAPPAAVWPWLVQIGYGRAGWYSYDAMDMRGKSADAIVPEWQSLAEGDMVPTSPDSAFQVRRLEPERTLVLYFDSAMVQEQVAKARAARHAGEAIEETPANLKAATVMFPANAEFAASQAFVLEPLDGGARTRLVERMRIRVEGGPKAMNAFASLFGFGAFVMMRKQMLGVRGRAERASAPAPAAEPA